MNSSSDLVHHPFAIPSRDGYPLRGDARYQDGLGDGAPAVVICHGFKGFKDWGFFPEVAAALAASGYLAISFNFSGSGIGSDLCDFTDPGGEWPADAGGASPASFRGGMRRPRALRPPPPCCAGSPPRVIR